MTKPASVEFGRRKIALQDGIDTVAGGGGGEMDARKHTSRWAFAWSLDAREEVVLRERERERENIPREKQVFTM